MALRYCLNGSTIRTTPLLQQIEVAAQAGFAGIELWHDKVDEHLATGGSLAEIREALARHQLAVPTTIYLPGWFDAHEEDYPLALAACRRRMEQAVALGAPHVIASPPLGRADVALGAARYRQLLELGESLGVLPAMKFLGFVEQLNTIEDALEVMQGCGHPKATTVLDPFHVFRGGGAADSIAKLTAQQIAISHFNDAPATPERTLQHDKDRVMPGEGHLDLGEYVRLLQATGYDGYLSLELFREELWEQEPLRVAETGLAKMRAVVEAA